MVRVTVNMPEAAAAVPEIKQRMLDAGVDAPLIGDFHYNGHLLLTRYPGVRRGARQVPHQSRQRRHRQAARRAVRDHLPGRASTTASPCASASTAAPSTRSWSWRRCRRTPTATSASTPTTSSTSAWCSRRSQSTELALETGLRPGPDHHLVQGVAAAAPDRRLPRAGAADRPAAASRADRGRHGHQGPGLVGLGDGRAAAAKASATRSASR